MGSLLPRLIIIGLAASVSPVAVMVLINVLSRKNARRNSLLFTLGYTLTLLALGIAGVYLLRLGGSGGTSKVDAYIDIALGVLCFAAIPLSVTRNGGKKAPQVESGMKASRAFLLGGISMVVNTSTFIVFVSGLHAISASDLDHYQYVLGVAILTLFTLTTLLIPLAIYFVFPSRSEKALAFLQTSFSRHSEVIGVSVSLIFAVYLLSKGIRAL
jgi:threonine/homoserine/homoserine lactone efflux protein